MFKVIFKNSRNEVFNCHVERYRITPSHADPRFSTMNINDTLYNVDIEDANGTNYYIRAYFEDNKAFEKFVNDLVNAESEYDTINAITPEKLNEYIAEKALADSHDVIAGLKVHVITYNGHVLTKNERDREMEGYLF